MKTLFTISLVLASFCSLGQPELRVGDDAPPIKARWLKGKPINNFEQDMVYVLEFWATWCGPCIKAMPHLTELAKKHADKVSFIGISVWERGRPGQTVSDFVDSFMKQKGHLMDYAVAMDGADSYMVTNWVESVGESSIPATIVVDKHGKIAWIGDPLSLDEPLAKIIEGTFDSKNFATQIASTQEKKFDKRRQQKARIGLITPAQDALKDKNYKLAMAEYDKIVAIHPSYKGTLESVYYTALLHLNPTKVYNIARYHKDSIQASAVMARIFSMEENLDKKFYAYAVDFYESQPEDHFNFPYMSSAYFNLGNSRKAFEIQQKWIDKLKTFTAPAPGSYVEKELQRLEQYRVAANM